MIIRNKNYLLVILAILFSSIAFDIVADDYKRGEVSITSPLDGEIVSQTFRVVFDIKNFDLSPAGTFDENTGHHHLIIDAALPNLNSPIPSSTNYLHFGKAQEYADITLAPGKHTLQLLLGDGNHIPHKKPIFSKPIEIKVKP
ncbi:MAG: DUF4399 domain-containing protein [Gammaproteobacteria bacterium]|nr:DUF4399 domain-containing protein [Gammaproteobacteria bacterium]